MNTEELGLIIGEASFVLLLFIYLYKRKSMPENLSKNGNKIFIAFANLLFWLWERKWKILIGIPLSIVSIIIVLSLISSLDKYALLGAIIGLIVVLLFEINSKLNNLNKE